MPAGRPTIYTTELGQTICDRIANGESLNKICQDEAMPARSNVIRWALGQVEDALEFQDKYAQARQVQSELLADEIHDIADDSAKDRVENGGKVTIDHEHIQRSKLRVDTRKWYLSAIVPRFKPKSELTHGLTDDLTKLISELDGKDTEIPDNQESE